MVRQRGSSVVVLILVIVAISLIIYTGRLLIKTYAGQFNPTSQVGPIASPVPSPSPLPTPTPDPNSPTYNWNEYNNQLLGFALKYPEKWTLPREHILEGRTEINFNGAFTVTVGTFTDSSGKELSFNEFLIQRQPSNSSWEDIVLNERKGKKVIYKIGTSGKEAIYVFPGLNQPNHLIVFSTISHPYYIDESKNIEIILTTFKFLN